MRDASHTPILAGNTMLPEQSSQLSSPTRIAPVKGGRNPSIWATLCSLPGIIAGSEQEEEAMLDLRYFNMYIDIRSSGLTFSTTMSIQPPACNNVDG